MSASARIFVVIVVLVLGAGGAFFYLLSRPDDGAEIEASNYGRPAESGPEEKKPGVPRRTDLGATPVDESAEGTTPEANAAETAAEAKAPKAEVTGRVVTEAGEPLPDCPVRVRRSRRSTSDRGGAIAVRQIIEGPSGARGEEIVRTDAQGRFKVLGAGVGSDLSLTAQPLSLCDASKSVKIEKPEALDVGDLVAAVGATIEGRVMSDASTPVRGAEVRAWKAEDTRTNFVVIGGPEGRNVGRTAISDDSGYFKIEGIEAGTAALKASSPDHPEVTLRDLKTKKGETLRNVTVNLPLGRSVEGTVLGEDGAPIADAMVSVKGDRFGLEVGDLLGPQDQRGRMATDAEGRFKLRGLLADKETVLRVRKPGYVAADNVAVPVDQRSISITLALSGVVFGYVTDAVTQKPIDDFTVTTRSGGLPFQQRAGGARILKGKEAADFLKIEAAANLYAVVDLSGGEARLEAKAAGFAPAKSGKLTVPSRQRVSCDLALQPEAVIAGVVVDAKGLAVQGARISNSTQAPEGRDGMRFRATISTDETESFVPADATVESDAEGRFEIRGLTAGTYYLRAEHESHSPSEPFEAALVAGQKKTGVRLELREGGVCQGIAYDPDGKPLADGRVSLTPARTEGSENMVIVGDMPDFDAGAARTATTGADGRFEIRGVTPGRYMAQVRAARPRREGGAAFAFSSFGGPARPQAGTPVEIEAGKTARVELRLAAKARIAGVVTEAGKAVPGAAVALRRAGEPVIMGLGGQKVVTDDAGAFEIKDIEPGEYRLVVSPAGAPVPTEKSVALVERQYLQEDVRLPTGIIMGRVTDRATGDGVEGVDIKCEPIKEKGETDAEETTTEIVGVMATSTDDEEGEMTMAFGGGTTTSVKADRDGRYELRNLPPGKYKVSVRGKGVLPIEKESVEVEEGKRVDKVDFATEKGSVIVVTVDAKSEGDPFVFGEAIPENGEPVSGGGPIGKPVKFQGLKSGAYKVRLHRGAEERTADVAVGAGERKEITIRF